LASINGRSAAGQRSNRADNEMLFKGEERPQGDTGKTDVQEWSVRFGE
jgi:hypothetical protein